MCVYAIWFVCRLLPFITIKKAVSVCLTFCCLLLYMFVDEKAVQFAQAEKLYYETALINSASTSSSTNPSHDNVTANNPG